MKKSLLLVSALFYSTLGIGLSGFSNDNVYSPLLCDGKKWIFEQGVTLQSWEFGEQAKYLTLEFCAYVVGDVQYEGHSGKRIDIQYLTDDAPDEIPLSNRSYDVFEIDHIIYIHYPQSEYLVPCLPLNLNVGDAIVHHWYDGVESNARSYIKAIDNININGESLKRWIIQNNVNYNVNDRIDDVVVEGIGSSCGAFDYIHQLETDNGVSYHSPKVIEVQINDVPIFTHEDFFTGLSNCKLLKNETGSLTEESIYDIYGHKLQTAPQKGIYIYNGKKLISQ